MYLFVVNTQVLNCTQLTQSAKLTLTLKTIIISEYAFVTLATWIIKTCRFLITRSANDSLWANTLPLEMLTILDLINNTLSAILTGSFATSKLTV